MTTEQIYSYAYDIVVFIACCEQTKSYENYELCMYVAALANAIRSGDKECVLLHRARLVDEWRCASDEAWVEEAGKMIVLVDEVLENM